MFNKGDKVTHETYGDGEVIGTYLYGVRFEGGDIRNVHVSELKTVPKYSIGQTVALYGGVQHTVLSDVFVDTDGRRSYVTRDDCGDCHLVPETSFED